MQNRLRGVALLLGMGLTLMGGAPPEEAAPAGDPASVARARTHYEKVLGELRTADTSALSEAQRATRLEAIRRLQRYCESENYPVNTVDPASNLPFYLDGAGRRCAVSTLLHEMGAERLVDRMARTNNHAFISTLSDDPDFQAWLARTGLTLAETVRIMAPATQGSDIRVPANPSASDPTGTTQPTEPVNPVQPTEPEVPGGPQPDGPLTGGGDGPGGPTTGGPRVPGGPGSGGPGAGGGNGPGGPMTGGGFTRGGGAGSLRETRSSLGANSWTLWWEFSKTEFYSPNPLVLQGDADALTGAKTPEEVQLALRAQMRLEVAPMVVRALGADEPEVRMAAAAALARIQGERAVPRLTRLLADESPAVRDRAVLALGATGSPIARETLLSIAQNGALDDQWVSRSAQGLAHIALALGVRNGMPNATAEMEELFKGYREEREQRLEVATIFHHQLAPSNRLGNAFHAVHPDEEQPLAVRARTVELIPSTSSSHKAAFEALQFYLNGNSLELRRSAALAMGSLDHALVLPQVMTAYELETEPVTRGFMLLSIARRGGDSAREFLMHELRRGKDKEMRPWTMLALGLAARGTDDAEVRDLLRSKSLPNVSRSARYLAVGMARDADSIPSLAKAAAMASKPWERARAAYALALIGSEEARLALRAVVWKEKSTFVRALQAFSLATFGHADDAPFIVQAAREISDPDMVAPCAVAVRYHGTQEALELAIANASDPTVAPLGRATLIEALGMMLDPKRPLAIAALYRRSNFGVLPRWAAAAYKSTF